MEIYKAAGEKISAETAHNISTCFSGKPKYLWVMLLNSEMNNKEKKMN